MDADRENGSPIEGSLDRSMINGMQLAQWDPLAIEKNLGALIEEDAHRLFSADLQRKSI
jgi:hypothetical protein